MSDDYARDFYPVGIGVGAGGAGGSGDGGGNGSVGSQCGGSSKGAVKSDEELLISLLL